MQLLNTLYVTTPESYIHLDNETRRVEVEKETRLEGSGSGNVLLRQAQHRLAGDPVFVLNVARKAKLADCIESHSCMVKELLQIDDELIPRIGLLDHMDGMSNY